MHAGISERVRRGDLQLIIWSIIAFRLIMKLCIHYFAPCCGETLDKGNLRTEAFILVHGLGGQATFGDVIAARTWSSWSYCVHSHEAERGESQEFQSCYSLSLTPQPIEWCHPYTGQAFSSGRPRYIYLYLFTDTFRGLLPLCFCVLWNWQSGISITNLLPVNVTPKDISSKHSFLFLALEPGGFIP